MACVNMEKVLVEDIIDYYLKSTNLEMLMLNALASFAKVFKVGEEGFLLSSRWIYLYSRLANSASPS